MNIYFTLAGKQNVIVLHVLTKCCEHEERMVESVVHGVDRLVSRLKHNKPKLKPLLSDQELVSSLLIAI